jgi:hypothetical protein
MLEYQLLLDIFWCREDKGARRWVRRLGERGVLPLKYLIIETTLAVHQEMEKRKIYLRTDRLGQLENR